MESEVTGREVTVVERRASWREDAGPEWTRRPIARLTYVASTRLWTLYSLDRNGRLHLYSRLRPTPKIDELLGELDRDPSGVFWG